MPSVCFVRAQLSVLRYPKHLVSSFTPMAMIISSRTRHRKATVASTANVNAKVQGECNQL